MRLFSSTTVRIICVLSLLLLLSVSVLVATAGASQVTTVTLVIEGDARDRVISELHITADDAVKSIGYKADRFRDVENITFYGDTDFTVTILLLSLPQDTRLKSTLTYGLNQAESTDHPFVLTIQNHTTPTVFTLHLALEDVPPTGGGSTPGSTPSSPDTPDTPSSPEIPSDPETPDTPTTPGSDGPYVPLLPPAGSVHSIVGFIPLAAGFLLLFLLFALRGNLVYRILKKHAKRQGEKPEKQQLKETAAAIISRIRDDAAYPQWRAESIAAERLKADIVKTLDEMQYPPAVPRDAVVAEIIKAAKGRINRRRL